MRLAGVEIDDFGFLGLVVEFEHVVEILEELLLLGGLQVGLEHFLYEARHEVLHRDPPDHLVESVAEVALS